MPPIKGTRTEKNLAISYASELMAQNRYLTFSGIAIKQGYEQIGAIFAETAANEKEHAKIFLKHLGGETPNIHVQLEIPSFFKGSTLENLKFSAGGENEEHTSMYPHMAAIAEQEGFEEIAKSFRMIALVEQKHELRFSKLAEQVKEGTVFKKKRIVSWKCRNCGYVTEGYEAPAECPSCAHPQAYFEIQELLE